MAAPLRESSKSQDRESLLDSIVGDAATLQDLVEDATSWCSQHGLVYGAGISDVPVATVPAPISLIPVPFPRESFLGAKQAATVFNLMADAVSRDDEYLHRVLAPAARYDPFTARLLELHGHTADARAKKVQSGRDFTLSITRTDYMVHQPTNALLQVELNTIAASFGCLSTLVSRMHHHILERYLSITGRTDSLDGDVTDRARLDSILESLPSNNAMDGLADALGQAVKSHGSPNSVLLMVVQPNERNAYDQKWLQFTLWERHRVRTIRRTLAEVAKQGRLSGIAGELEVDGHVVSVAYFRAGYSPDDYPTLIEWEGRKLIEQSDAIACPSVAMQLAGAKKIQQDLSGPGVVESFLRNEEDASLLRCYFAGLWGLDTLGSSEDVGLVVADAIDHPERYVLKPQREGGGNNLYGEGLRSKLLQARQSTNGIERVGDLILMERILPPQHKAVMIRLGQAAVVETLSELGIYGTYLRHGDEVILNKEVGHLVRTKAATSDEGGVAAGFAVLDSPALLT
jgi:glutathione synthetase